MIAKVEGGGDFSTSVTGMTYYAHGSIYTRHIHYLFHLHSTHQYQSNKMSQVNLAGHQVGHVGFGLMRMSIHPLLYCWLMYRIDLDSRAGR